MSTSAPRSPEYVLGTADDEFARLGFQHRLWSDLAHRTWRDAGIAPGQTVLDLGCGPGYASFDLASLVGGVNPTATGGHVYAVDESVPFIERLTEQAAARGFSHITPIQADAHDLATLKLPKAGIDLIYMRWVLCFVRDPQAIVNAAAALLKAPSAGVRGGRFAVNDYFNYEAMTLAPRRKSFSRGINAVAESWRARGGDPDIAGRLPGICATAGLKVIDLKVEQRIATPTDTMWAWPTAFWSNFVPRLVEAKHLTQAEASEFMADWESASKDPHAFIALPPVYSLIAARE